MWAVPFNADGILIKLLVLAKIAVKVMMHKNNNTSWNMIFVCPEYVNCISRMYTLLLTSSHGRGLQHYLDSSHYIVRFRPGARLVDIQDLMWPFPRTGYGAPRVVVVHLGSNDIMTREGKIRVGGEFSSYVLNVLDTVASYFPGSDVVWSNIFPAAKGRWIPSAETAHLRNTIAYKVSRNVRMEYPTLNHHWARINRTAPNMEMLARDGLHLSEEGKRMFCQEISEYGKYL